MKHCFLFALLFVVTALSAQNQGKPGGIFDHAIEVTTYSDWGKDYLTITDLHAYFGKEDDTDTFTTLRPIEDEALQEIVYPWLADIILEVNNKSTKGMTPQQFYDIIDTASIFTLKFKHISANTIHTQQFAINRIMDENIKKYRGLNKFLTSYNKSDSGPYERDNKHKNVFDEISDKRFDFSKIKTYDYLIVGNDPLHDTEILDKVLKLFLTRDTKKPDILFCIAKNIDESISSTYIPPTSRTINTGSTTTPIYNYLTKTYSYVTQQHNSTIHEGGYTKNTKTGAVYLELSALDAKRINDKSQTAPPIVWQMTATKNYTNYNFELTKEYLAMASWAYFPPNDRWCFDSEEVHEYAGLVADPTNPSMVAEVEPGSRAEVAGFKKGDVIKKIEYYHGFAKRWYCVRQSNREKYNKIYNMKLRNTVEYLNGNCNHYDPIKYDTYVTILRGKKEFTLKLLSHKKTFYRSYLLHTTEK